MCARTTIAICQSVHKKRKTHKTGGRDPALAQLRRKTNFVETLNNVANATTRCGQPLNTVRLMTCHYTVQGLHKDFFTPTLCRGRGEGILPVGNITRAWLHNELLLRRNNGGPKGSCCVDRWAVTSTRHVSNRACLQYLYTTTTTLLGAHFDRAH